jgi:hypothetical protein
VIYDSAGDPDSWPGVATFSPPRGVNPTTERPILDLVFGGKYLRSDAACPLGNCGGTGRCTGDKYLAEVRIRGQIVPGLSQAADGSFTAPHASQRLYVIATGECNAFPVDNNGTTQLVVIQDGAVVARAIMDGGSGLGAVLDLDGDGQHELLLTASYVGGGASSGASARLARFEGSQLVTSRKFGTVYGDDCQLFPQSKRKHSVIHATTRPGQPPTFRIEHKTEPCP